MAPGTPRPGEAILGAYRLAVDLLQETLVKVQAAWNQLIDAVQGLLRRAQHFLNTDSIWSTIVQKFTQDVVDAIEAINSLISRIRPEVDKLFEALRKAADNSVPVFSLFETAITYSHDIVDQVSGISADMTGHGDIDLWRGPAKISYEKRVADQIGAADAATAKVEATSRWLGDVGSMNTAYLANIGHMGAELVGQFVTAAIDAAETAAGSIPSYVITLQHLSEFVGTAVQHSIDWVIDLQEHFVNSLNAVNDLQNDTSDKTGFGRDYSWPAAASMA
ncbi:MAG: hypothetical protein ABW022_09555 [Actinoplanes sp.]